MRHARQPGPCRVPGFEHVRPLCRRNDDERDRRGGGGGGGGGRHVGKGHGGATGGGVSALFDRPAWQTVEVASLNPSSIDGRVVPDVAALAGPPLYQLTLLGRSAPNGGTSASAPLWASLIA